jgi:pantoate--beta-alanine ligase
MKIVRTALRAALADRRTRGRRGFVPTMGALHEGHLALVHAARSECPDVVASIFVNPKQFNDSQDLARYPRQEDRDAEMLLAAGVDVLFVPAVDEMYPAGDATTIVMEGAARGFEGDHRPGHFNGVAIVCLKLFGLVEPDVVYLGQKDAQQVAVLRQLVRDVRLNLEIRVAPTVRDKDGLALSSRNARLSPDERSSALAIPRALAAAVAAYRQGRDPVAAARPLLTDLEVDYVDVVTFDGQATLVLAVRAGETRLIDNVPLEDPKRAGL